MSDGVVPFQKARIHPTADVHPSARVSRGAVIWGNVGILADCVIGEDVSIGRGSEIGRGSVIGKGSRIGSGVFLPPHSKIGEYVFLGPHVVCTDDKFPKVQRVWDKAYTPLPPTIRDGAAIGAGVIILPGITIGIAARVAAGSIVTKDVPDYTAVRGGPARYLALPHDHEWNPLSQFEGPGAIYQRTAR